MKEKIKELWKLCFDDSEEFVEMYFQMRYKNEINMAIESGNEIISALQMIPYPMNFCNKQIATSYISGACTHPEFQNRGAMRQLLSQAFTRMLQGGVYLSTLIPAHNWLFDYYARLGYAPVFRYSTQEISLSGSAPSPDIMIEKISEYQEAVYSYLNGKLSQCPFRVQHTAEDFRVIMADLALDNGILLAAKTNNEISGISIAVKREGHIIINELLSESKEIECSLLHATQKHYGCDRMTRILPPDDRFPQQALGMARIINVKEVLQLYAACFPKDEMQIEVSDKQLSTNNGYYYLNNGKCMNSAKRLPGSHLALTIGELTEKVFAASSPYMSLMLN